MGIRINKQLGWVLTGEKINLELLEHCTLEDLKRENINNYEFCQLDLMYPNLDLKTACSEFVNDVSDEYTPGDYLYIFSPPHVGKYPNGNDWHRTDCSIDYYDADHALRQIKYVHNEIFPYSKNFIVSKTLKELNKVQSEQCRLFSDVPHIFQNPVRQDLIDLGLDLNQPLKNQIHMRCPEVLRLILEKCQVSEYQKLRPAIVTYWR